MRWIVVVCVVIVAACGNITRKNDGSGSDTVKPAREIVSAGGKMKSQSFTFEVQVGHAVRQSTAKSAKFTIEGNAAVKP